MLPSRHAILAFSVLDVLAAINNEVDHQKTRNYWKYLKGKLKTDSIYNYISMRYAS